MSWDCVHMFAFASCRPRRAAAAAPSVSNEAHMCDPKFLSRHLGFTSLCVFGLIIAGVVTCLNIKRDVSEAFSCYEAVMASDWYQASFDGVHNTPFLSYGDSILSYSTVITIVALLIFAVPLALVSIFFYCAVCCAVMGGALKEPGSDVANGHHGKQAILAGRLRAARCCNKAAMFFLVIFAALFFVVTRVTSVFAQQLPEEQAGYEYGIFDCFGETWNTTKPFVEISGEVVDRISSSMMMMAVLFAIAAIAAGFVSSVLHQRINSQGLPNPRMQMQGGWGGGTTPPPACYNYGPGGVQMSPVSPATYGGADFGGAPRGYPPTTISVQNGRL